MKNLPEQHIDASGRIKAAPGQRHMHKINLGEKHGQAKRSDFDPGGPEVPARAARERVNPAEANDLRRTPLIDVTAITPAGSGNHGAVPPPRKL
jgi:hypothetical protein